MASLRQRSSLGRLDEMVHSGFTPTSSLIMLTTWSLRRSGGGSDLVFFAILHVHMDKDLPRYYTHSLDLLEYMWTIEVDKKTPTSMKCKEQKGTDEEILVQSSMYPIF